MEERLRTQVAVEALQVRIWRLRGEGYLLGAGGGRDICWGREADTQVAVEALQVRRGAALVCFCHGL
jgi:hypothetical protein